MPEVIPPPPKPMRGGKVTNIVRGILSRSRLARNSDRHLFLEFMQAGGMELSPKQQEIFLHLPSLESARRVRQKLQEGGEYPADAKIANERGYKSMRMQQMTPNAKPETIEKVIDNQPKAVSWLNDD